MEASQQGETVVGDSGLNEDGSVRQAPSSAPAPAAPAAGEKAQDKATEGDGGDAKPPEQPHRPQGAAA